MQNSYDIKLNQPSIKPSVSNVFSSLNDYINAPSVSLVQEESSSDCETPDLRREESVLKIESTDCTVIKNITTDTGSISVIKNDIGTASSVSKLSNAVSLPPKYQNILLPIKLDSCVEKPSNVAIAEHKAPETAVLPETSKTMNIDRSLKVQPEKSERQETKSIIDGPEHVYENVYIGTDIPKTQEIYATVNKVKKPEPKEAKPETKERVDSEVKHTYENVDFAAKTDLHDKDPVYECIYIGNRENLPETTTELEIAAKKMDQFYTSKKSQELEAKGSNTTRLVFQTVQLNAPSTEPKPIGFGNIDDLSEEELNRYLAELEAEERANEAAAAEPTVQKFQNTEDDEDANEAPIFESVTIGELPSVSEEDLQQKAKKFPVIDYSKSGVSGEGSSDFLAKKSSEKFHEPTKPIAKAKEDKGRIKKSKKTNEKVRKCSDNMDIGQQCVPRNEEGRPAEGVTAQDEENGNCISEDCVEKESSEASSGKNTEDEDLQQNKQPETNSQNLSVEESGEVEDQFVNSELNLDNEETVSKLNMNETLSRREDDNETRISDVDNNVDHNENSEEDLDRPTRPQTLDIVSTVNMTEFTTGN